MAIVRLSINDFLQQSKDRLVIDVRSPSEYRHAHLPGAVSLPLFTDEERKIVGTTYKQQSREEAIKIGLDMFGPKMRTMVETVEELIGSVHSTVSTSIANSQLLTANSKPEKSNTIFLYCWRGGMRSAAVAWLLDLYGFKVHTLAGGYKAFRNHVLQSFARPFAFRIIGGFTGSGKTEVLQELERRGDAIIDLEKIACHKGSAFGSFKMPPQPTQEMFENILSYALEALPPHHETIWLEDESQRIGNLNLPAALWETMRNSPLVFLEVPFEERLQHLVEEYSQCEKEKLIASVQRISKRLGPLETKNTLAFLEANNFKEAFRILLSYYDKRYLKGLHNREQLSALLTKLSCETVTSANAYLLTKHQPA